MIKLISVDIDGTLLNDNRQIGKRTLEIVPKLEDILFVLNTGRPFDGVLPMIQQLGLHNEHNFCITNTGAVIYDNMGEKSVSEYMLGPSDFERITKIKPEGLSVVIYNAHELYCNDSVINQALQWQLEILKMPLLYYDPDSGEKIERVNLIGPVERIQEFSAKYNDELSKDYYTIVNEPTVFEILHKESGKERALERLRKNLGLQKEEVMAIGDNANDIEMLKVAGFGVAMGNGTDEVKKIADFVTKTNNEDGVAYAIEKFIYGKNE